MCFFEILSFKKVTEKSTDFWVVFFGVGENGDEGVMEISFRKNGQLQWRNPQLSEGENEDLKKMSFFLGERLGKCWLMIPHLFGRLQWTWKMLVQKTLNFGIPNWKSPPGPHAPKQKGPCSHSKRHLFRERYPHFRIKQDHQPTCITPFIIMANFTSHQAFPNKKTCWNRQGTSMSNSVGGTQTSSASIFNSWRLSAKACLLQPLFLRGHVCFWGSMLKVDQNFGNCIEFIANNKRYMLGIALVHVIPYVWIGIASNG